MAAFIASYDLKETKPQPYGEFIAQAEKRGWSTWIKSSKGQWNKLPNTTLTGDFVDIDAAEKALADTRVATQAALGISVSLEKWIISARGTCKFVSDEKVPG
jgi:hypothetical protein